MAYSPNFTGVSEYKFTAVYSDNHFQQIKTLYNVTPNRKILLEFGEELTAYTAKIAIFMSTDPTGNGERYNLEINAEGKTVHVSEIGGWKDECWLFLLLFPLNQFADILIRQRGIIADAF